MADFSNYRIMVKRVSGETKDNAPSYSDRATLLVTERSVQAAEGRAERWAQQRYGGRWRTTFSTSEGLSLHDSARVRVGDSREQ